MLNLQLTRYALKFLADVFEKFADFIVSVKNEAVSEKDQMESDKLTKNQI